LLSPVGDDRGAWRSLLKKIFVNKTATRIVAANVIVVVLINANLPIDIDVNVPLLTQSRPRR